VNGARTLRAAALVAAASIGLGGCALTASSTPSRPVVAKVIRHHRVSTAVRVVVRNFRTYAVGQTGVMNSSSQHASLRITVGSPSLSTTRLSKTYGYPPRHGHYVTFRLMIGNTGQVPIEIQRLDFWVRTPGLPKSTTDGGNAPFSGSGSQLDTTELSPGQSVSNDLTFDVAQPTGTLFYAPGGHPALAWTF
jgi:hypothetical protein